MVKSNWIEAIIGSEYSRNRIAFNDYPEREYTRKLMPGLETRDSTKVLKI